MKVPPVEYFNMYVVGAPGSKSDTYTINIAGMTNDPSEFDSFFVRVDFSGSGRINFVMSSRPFTHYFTYAAKITRVKLPSGKFSFQISPWDGKPPGMYND